MTDNVLAPLFDIYDFNLMPPSRPAALRNFVVQFEDSRFEISDGEATLDMKKAELVVNMKTARVAFHLAEQARSMAGLLEVLASCNRVTILPTHDLQASRHFSLRMGAGNA